MLRSVHSPVVSHPRQSCAVSLAGPGGRRPTSPRGPSGRLLSTSISRSATLIRSCSDSTVSSSSTGTGTCATIGPVSTPVVDHEQGRPGDLHAVAERVGGAVHPREGRAQRGVGVDHRERGRGAAAPTSFMKPAETTRSGSVLDDRVGQRPVPVLARRRSRAPGARRWGRRPARRGPAPRCRRGRRRRRPPRRRTPGRRRRRAGPAGWCRCRRRGRRDARPQPRRYGRGPGAATRSWPARPPGRRCRTR